MAKSMLTELARARLFQVPSLYIKIRAGFNKPGAMSQEFPLAVHSSLVEHCLATVAPMTTETTRARK